MRVSVCFSISLSTRPATIGVNFGTNQSKTFAFFQSSVGAPQNFIWAQMCWTESAEVVNFHIMCYNESLLVGYAFFSPFSPSLPFLVSFVAALLLACHERKKKKASLIYSPPPPLSHPLLFCKVNFLNPIKRGTARQTRQGTEIERETFLFF